jgi:hypothetical protein
MPSPELKKKSIGGRLEMISQTETGLPRATQFRYFL